MNVPAFTRLGAALLWLTLPLAARAEVDRSDPASYGIGVVVCTDAAYPPGASCFADLAWLSQPVELYAEASKDATHLGTILDPAEALQGWQPFHFWPLGGGKADLDTVEIAYEDSAPIVYQEKGEWLRSGQGWLHGPDLRLGEVTRFEPWTLILSRLSREPLDDRGYLGWFYPLADQALHAEPGGAALGPAWRVSDRENLPELLVIETKGNWVKVQVDRNFTTCGDRDQAPEGPTGWIRLTDDQGHPLVYWYTRGC